jgi:KDO2-lipid IV(A) lauroyltransferase
VTQAAATPTPAKKPKRPPGPVEEWAAYLLARGAAAVIAALRPHDAVALAQAAGRGMYHVDRRHRERTLWQLRIAFPDLSEPQRDQLAHRCFQHLLLLAAEVVLTPRLIHRDNWPGMIRVGEGIGQAIELLNRGKPCILLTGHLGNWEVLGNTLALLGYKVAALARPLPHQRVNRWLLQIREARGMRIITKFDATDSMHAVLNAGGLLAFIADQNAGRRGIHVPFFNRLASTYKSIALMAMHYRTPILVGGSPRFTDQPDQPVRFGLELSDIIHPKDWEPQPDPLFYITARYTRSLEALVRRHPEQYLWMHRRWKTRPRHELDAKPLPAPLRRKLESLPWITPADLLELAKPVDYHSITRGRLKL